MAGRGYLVAQVGDVGWPACGLVGEPDSGDVAKPTAWGGLQSKSSKSGKRPDIQLCLAESAMQPEDRQKFPPPVPTTDKRRTRLGPGCGAAGGLASDAGRRVTAGCCSCPS